MLPWQAPLDPASVLGDDWVARIRAEHERLGEQCPCGNGRVARSIHDEELQVMRERVAEQWEND